MLNIGFTRPGQGKDRYMGGKAMRKAALLLTALVIGMNGPIVAQTQKPLWQRQSDEAQKQYDAKDYPGQEVKLRNALKDARQRGVSGKELATILQNLGEAIYNQYHYPDALPFFQEALSIREKVYPADAPEVGKSLYYVGYCLHGTNIDDEALPLLERSLQIAEKHSGAESLEAYGPLALMQTIYFKRNPARAAEYSERCAAIIKKLYPGNNYSTYQSSAITGAMKESAGDYKGAMAAYKEAQTIKRALPADALPPDNLDQHLRHAEEMLVSHRPDTEMVPLPPSERPTEPSRPVTPILPITPQAPIATEKPIRQKPHRVELPELPVQDQGKYAFYVDGKRVSYQVYRATALAKRASDLIESKSYEPALEDLKQSLSLDPNNAFAQCAYGTTLARLHRIDEAIDALKESIKMKPNFDAAWVALAGLYEEKGLLDDALTAYRQYLRRFPHDAAREWILSSARLIEKERQARLAPSKCPAMAEADGVHDYVTDAARDGMVRWKKTDMPVTVCITPPSSSAEDRKIAELVKRCLAEWSGAAPQLVKFGLVDDPRSAKINITWAGEGRLCENAEAGEAQVRTDGGNVIRAIIGIKIDDGADDATLHSTILHEIGHTLGLLGHSPNNQDVMYFTELMSGPVAGLSERDKKTINLLYSWEPPSRSISN